MSFYDSFTALASRKIVGCSSAVVANGDSKLISGVEAEARRIVKAKYAEEWNSAGFFRRLKLLRKMNTETRELAAKLMPNVSPDALF